MPDPFITTVRVRPARSAKLVAAGVAVNGKKLVEVTVYGETVAIVDANVADGEAVQWVDPRFADRERKLAQFVQASVDLMQLGQPAPVPAAA